MLTKDLFWTACKLPRFSESVDSAFSSAVKSDYGAKEEKKKENRFSKFDLSAPDVKSASRNNGTQMIVGARLEDIGHGCWDTRSTMQARARSDNSYGIEF